MSSCDPSFRRSRLKIPSGLRTCLLPQARQAAAKAPVGVGQTHPYRQIWAGFPALTAAFSLVLGNSPVILKRLLSVLRHCAGRRPVRLLPARYRRVSLDRLPRLDGIGPLTGIPRRQVRTADSVPGVSGLRWFVHHNPHLLPQHDRILSRRLRRPARSDRRRSRNR